jgi:hypothetical protein
MKAEGFYRTFQRRSVVPMHLDLFQLSLIPDGTLDGMILTEGIKNISMSLVSTDGNGNWKINKCRKTMESNHGWRGERTNHLTYFGTFGHP